MFIYVWTVSEIWYEKFSTSISTHSINLQNDTLQIYTTW